MIKIKYHNYYPQGNSIEEFIQWSKIQYYADNCNCYFRGQAKTEWLLIPTIFREEGYSIDKEIETCSNSLKDITNNQNSLSRIEKLCLLQHYGKKTRLLDISKNPLVSLWFACRTSTDSEKDSNGCVYIGSLPSSNYNCYTSRISKYSEILAGLIIDSTEGLDVDEFFINECYGNENILIHDLWCSYVYIEIPFTINNPRVINQEGAFIIPPLIDREKLPRDKKLPLNEYLQNKYFFCGPLEKHIFIKQYGMFKYSDNSNIVNDIEKGLSIPTLGTYAFSEERFIVRREYKETYLNQLSDQGINEKYLFPDKTT